MERYTPLFRLSYLAALVSGILLQTVQAQVMASVSEDTTDREVKTDHSTKQQEEYAFDPNLFKGSGLTPSMIERFNHADQVEAGMYKVDIYINGRFFERGNIRFEKDEQNKQGAVACLNADLIERAGILGDMDYRQQHKENTQVQSAQCLTLAQVATGSVSSFDFSNLRLDLTVPQSLMKNLPRGYVNPSELDVGTSIGFINYMGNYYYTESRLGNHLNNESAFLSLNGGINIGKWQYRQQSNLSMNDDHETTWQNIRSYVQRPIEQLQSQLTLGQLYTSGRFFSGLAFKGLNLATDERMRPESLRGYAPVIRGTAQSNAKVSVQQNGRDIYQITVAPGPFEITDLYPTNYNGNLTVVVTEADGSTHSTEIPYAAVPTSLREGISNYSFSAGKTDQNMGLNSYFADLNYEYGVNNLITLNSGLRIADDYQAMALGNVLGGRYGAIGSNISYSRAKLPTDNNDYVDGWMADLTYSKTLTPTQTTFSLASYRYSTSGYRDLNDVLGIRQAWQDGVVYTSSTYLQRSRFQVSMSQPLGRYGSFYVTGSTQDYRDGRDRDTSLQLGYNKNFGILSMHLTYTRQKIHTLNNGVLKEERFDNFGGLSINMPLGRSRNVMTPNLNANYNRSNDMDNYQVGVSGALDQDYSLSYNVGMNGMGNDQQTYNAGLYKRFSNIQLGLNTAYSDQYWQGSVNASGAMAVHSGGITLGQYVGDTFALIEAKDATGAKIVSAPTSKIDRFGYALLPSVSPYRYNTIALDPQGMSGDVELEGGEQRIAPYAGAAVKVKFKTRRGYSVLIQSRLADGQIIPMGADVLKDTGEVIGMVGQNGQVYVRVEQQQGQLTLRWGTDAGQSCQLPYQLDAQQLGQPLIKLQATCTFGE
ncbi:fimbria/pilus outer membrane usher protein [Acinetobacter sp. VNH17]|uniref:Fimbria/pilus outer membrane usher protein n=1 Tax=Acinetobacter thutiue TaxID=2998078 RepID=A0ABT7WJ17_9GAMM|nr:fimbria/pilus outer membrane usher protein [Acinetobacter thutiue]MCY6410565.1 fimbrial biogenesis outer membrane usher protein [Acinetobacter thutiue]MDN0012666.1 fimbria/pilus outer membrane usher protein [Acinetobacter thutiue]